MTVEAALDRSSRKDAEFWGIRTELEAMENENPNIIGSEQAFLSFLWALNLVTVLVCLCGMVGNGAVTWLLGFRMKRNPVHVYILNLAAADFLFVFIRFIDIQLFYWGGYPEVVLYVKEAIQDSSFLAGQGLLMAISAERCVSVLWPLWYKCHRPAHLSAILCALTWALSLCEIVFQALCFKIGEFFCDTLFSSKYYISFLTFLVLSASNLTTLLRVQCCSLARRPSPLHLTTLLTVSAFVLLSLPGGVVYAVCKLRSPATMCRLLGVFDLLNCLDTMNCAVNPIIYFFVGWFRQQQDRKKTLQRLLQTALTDEGEGSEQRRGIAVPTQDSVSPEHRGGGALLSVHPDPANKVITSGSNI